MLIISALTPSQQDRHSAPSWLLYAQASESGQRCRRRRETLTSMTSLSETVQLRRWGKRSKVKASCEDHDHVFIDGAGCMLFPRRLSRESRLAAELSWARGQGQSPKLMCDGRQRHAPCASPGRPPLSPRTPYLPPRRRPCQCTALSASLSPSSLFITRNHFDTLR